MRNPIKRLKTTCQEEDGKVIAGKVVKKSALRTYETQKKEKKSFFYLCLTDETDYIKVMVYGKRRFKSFFEGKSYTFRNIIMQPLENQVLMKVNESTTVSETTHVDVPKHLELEAQKLIPEESPVYSIKQILILEEKTCVSVEGTVMKINKLKGVEIIENQRKQTMRKFELKDGEDNKMEVTLWGNATKHLKGTSVGDVVKVINVKTSKYYGTVSLNSTGFTRIIRVQQAAVQQATMEIIGVIKAVKTRTELEARANGKIETFTVSSPLLAKALQIKLDDDFKCRLLEKIQFSAEAEIQGNKIKKLEVLRDVK